MEAAKQLISVVVINHSVVENTNGLPREYIEDFTNFKKLLEDATLQLSADKSKRLKKFVSERSDTLNKVTCGKKFLHETYEVLFIILQNLGTEEVWYYFHDLVSHYWNSLKAKYAQAKLDLVDIFPAEIYEGLVKDIWNYVKVDYIAIKLKGGEENDKLVQEVLDSLDEYLQKPNLLKEDCYKIVENHVGSKNFKLQSYDLKFLEDKVGYLGDYFKIQIVFKSQPDGNQVLNLFAKCLPSHSLLPIALKTFPKEDFFYGEFTSRVKEFGLQGIDNFFPRCYFTRKNDVIVMEDATLQGYSMLNHGDVPDLQLASLMVKSLAKMHSSSLMLEEKMSKKLGSLYRIDAEYYDFIQESMFTHTMFAGLVMVCATRTIHEYLLDQFPEVPKKIPMRIFKRRVEFLNRRTFIEGHKSFKYRNALNHGDLWNSNFLISSEELGKPRNCLLVDFQLVRYQPPALDLLLFIYFNMFKQTRQLHSKSIINEYYEEMKRIFKLNDLDFENVYSSESFWESFEYYKPLAICMVLSYSQMLCMSSEFRDHLLADKEKSERFFWIQRGDVLDQALEDPEYRAKIKVLVEDLYECCEVMKYP